MEKTYSDILKIFNFAFTFLQNICDETFCIFCFSEGSQTPERHNRMEAGQRKEGQELDRTGEMQRTGVIDRTRGNKARRNAGQEGCTGQERFMTEGMHGTGESSDRRDARDRRD